MARARKRWYGVVAFRSIFGVLLGTVMIPTLLLTSVGIITLALWRETFDIVFGVLILSFSAASIVGGILATVLVGRSARRAGQQSDLVSTVSHELKTPLTSIKMFAETLLLGHAREEAERRECLEHIVKEAERLSVLVERLLDVRRMEEGLKTFARKPVVIATVVHDAVRSQVPLLKERGVAVPTSVEDGLPTVTGDHEALVSALANLVQNALVHGGGSVDVRARRDGKSVLLVVEDQGPGIPRRAMRRIFERFYRTGEKLSPSTGGMGIGLSLVKEIVEAHGGGVDVQSQEGRGSKFTIRLPADTQE